MWLDDPQHERTERWLRGQLDRIWDRYFSDVERANRVDIAFARGWKYRLGMIALSESAASTYIGINQLLREPEVPESIITVTIAHELVHYSHGFGSPLPRLYDDPHAGDIVTIDLRRRGLRRELQEYNQWLADCWFSFYARCRQAQAHRRARRLQQGEVVTVRRLPAAASQIREGGRRTRTTRRSD